MTAALLSYSTRLRVKIEHHEVRTGFILKSPLHAVRLTVDFPHEGKQIIRQRRLEEHVLLERWLADAKPDDEPDWYALRVGHLLDRKPDRFRCRTPADAKAYEARLTEAMHAMKGVAQRERRARRITVFEI